MKTHAPFRVHGFGLVVIGAGLLMLPLLRAERHQFGNDSDVKAAILPTPPPIGGILYVVDSTGDGDLVGPSTDCDDGTGHCTLRAAITASNLHSGADGISFNLPAPSTINLTSPLPNIFGPVTPTLALFNSSQQRIALNDNWADAANAQSIDPGLRPGRSAESALLISLAPALTLSSDQTASASSPAGAQIRIVWRVGGPGVG
jgi:CSLREA domain-containing protein